MKKEMKNKEVSAQKPLSFAFHPKATIFICRQVFWLVLFWRPSHLSVNKQWRKWGQNILSDLQLRG